VLGSTVIGGMIAAFGIAIFLIPVTSYVIERLFAGRKGMALGAASRAIASRA
jgi:hypothetical protein